MSLGSLAYGDFHDLAVDQLPVHWIGRPFEAGIDESSDLFPLFRYKSDALRTCLRRMVSTFSVARRYRSKRWDRIPFRIKASVILGTFQEDARDSVSIPRNRRADGYE